jgi:hypothetical protein
MMGFAKLNPSYELDGIKVQIRSPLGDKQWKKVAWVYDRLASALAFLQQARILASDQEMSRLEASRSLSDLGCRERL